MFIQQFRICFQITEVFQHFAQCLHCVRNSTVIKIQNHALVINVFTQSLLHMQFICNKLCVKTAVLYENIIGQLGRDAFKAT